MLVHSVPSFTEEETLTHRSVTGVRYKAFICQHGEETSVHDRYEFGRVLGEGGTGSTWVAYPKGLDGGKASDEMRDFGSRAIKKLLKHTLPDHSPAGFLAEVELLKELDHPNICKLHEVFHDAHAIYIVMDLCAGGELFDRISEMEGLCEREAAHLTSQIVHALYYCHSSHGIVHRDIKPENILFVSREEGSPVKLIDFGIACHFKPLELLHDEVGTEAYEAPEILKGEPYGEKCDLWSLGAVLYVMLGGYMPFGSKADALAGRFSFGGGDWRHVSGEAKDLIGRLLVVDPSERLSAGQALEHPWLKRHSDDYATEIPRSVFQRLSNFRKTSNFRRIVLMLFSRHLGANDLPELFHAFQSMDTNGDGRLSLEELEAGISNVMSKQPADELRESFQAIDIDGSGSIDYSEFVAAALDRKLLIREDLCLQVFRTLDRDSSGTIEISELHALLERVETEEFLGKELHDEARAMLAQYDVDQDGKLDIREFAAFLTQNTVEDLSSKGLKGRNARFMRGGTVSCSPSSFKITHFKSEPPQRTRMSNPFFTPLPAEIKEECGTPAQTPMGVS